MRPVQFGLQLWPQNTSWNTGASSASGRQSSGIASAPCSRRMAGTLELSTSLWMV